MKIYILNTHKSKMRLLVIGATGSGKTTFARQLSRIFKIPFYTTDDIVFKNKFKIRNSEEVREKKLKFIIKRKNWIIEGVHAGKWLEPVFVSAEVVFLLNINKFNIYKNLIKRHFKNKEGIRETIKLMYWAYQYNTDNLIWHKRAASKYKNTLFILKNNAEILQALKKMSETKSLPI